MLKLYEITANYSKIMEAIFENDGVVSDHLGATLDETQDEFNTKIDNIAKMVKNLESEQPAFKAEGQRLLNRAKAIQNNIDWLKNYIKEGMNRLGTKEVKGKILTVKIRPSPPSCIILDDKIVPPQFIRVISEIKEVNQKAVIEHYKKEGKIIPGTDISVGTTLTIR
jgi:hypothetical protein